MHVHRISHLLRVPEADIFGVIGFYTLFHDNQPAAASFAFAPIRLARWPARMMFCMNCASAWTSAKVK